jgi:D-xylose transport system permease protein
MSTTPPPAGTTTLEPDPDEASLSAVTTDVASNEALASSLGEYAGAWWRKVKNGESGVLPVLAGLVVIVIIFQTENSKFLTAGNLTNLIVQGSAFILLGMAEVFVLLLGEIDLSAGYVGAVGAGVTVALAAPGRDHAWWLCILAGLAVCAAIGIVQGLLITLLKLPSFVVTLAGLLAFEGVLIWYLNREAGSNGGGTIAISTDSVLYKLVNGNLGVVTGWVLMVVAVAALGGAMLYRYLGRRSAGLAVPPFGLVVLKIAALAVAGIVLVLICNSDRSIGFAKLQGVPWVVPVVLAVLAAWTFLLDRTKFGRYIYAIGGNAEAARRAGIKVTRIRVIAFGLTSVTAGMAGIVLASRLGSISTNVDGGQLVLYAVAAAVIGGTSLFGGRGKMVHALLGGLVIATIYNGMGLIGLTADVQFMVTALVLLGAVTVDALARRGRSA